MKNVFITLASTKQDWTDYVLLPSVMLLFVFVMYRIYKIIHKYRKIKSSIASENSILYYSIVLWFKKPQLPSGRYYTYHKTSQYKVITIVFIILIVIETVAMHFLLSIWSDWLAWIATALSFYTALYLIATYNSYCYLPHLLNEKRLLVRLGFQNSAEIMLTNIDKITAAKQIGLGDQVDKRAFYAHTSFDSPHFQIHLKEPIKIKHVLGLEKEVDSVVLYADNHKELEMELKTSILIKINTT